MRIMVLFFIFSTIFIGLINPQSILIIEEPKLTIATSSAAFVPYKFLKISDTQQSSAYDNSGPESVYQLVGTLLEEHDIEFLLHSGDLTEWGGEQQDFDIYFWPYMESINDSVPIYFAVGNHDYKRYGLKGDDTDLVTFRSNVNNPGNEIYYSFNTPQNDTHFIVLNSNYLEGEGMGDRNETKSHAQIDWLISDLENNTIERVVVMFHHSLYALNPGYLNQYKAVRKAWEDIFVEYCIDVVLTGHDHYFYHTHRYGIDHIVSGVAATTLTRPIPEHPDVPWQDGDIEDVGNHVAIYEATETGFNINLTFTNGSSFAFSIEAPIIDNIPPRIISSNPVTAYEETDGYTVSWVVDDDHPNNYSILQDSSIVLTGNWTNRYPIEYSLDELSVGTYNFTVLISDARGFSTSSEIVAQVLPGAAPITSTTTTTTTTTTTSAASTIGFELFSLLSVLSAYLLKRKK